VSGRPGDETSPTGDPAVRRLSERLEAEQARLERVVRWLPELVSQGDAEGLRSGLVELVLDVCDGAVALFVAHEEDERAATMSGRRQGFRDLPLVRRAPLLAAVFSATEVLRIDDVARWAPDESSRLYGSMSDGRMIRSWLAAPVLSTAGVALGVLFVGHPRPHAFEARHERLIDGIARQLAVALENAHLLEERTRVATVLQETLLPPLLPDIPGADIAARYRPAGDESLVGGDFYDVFPTNDGRWAAVIGDVCGVGPEAAAVTGIARYTLRAVARRDSSPSGALTALNEAIVNDRDEPRFCTAVVLSLRAARQGLAVTLSSAGHPPALILRDHGIVESVDRLLGPLLGVFPQARFEEEKIELRSGDALVLYTDGVIEARAGSREMFGEQRLAELLATCGGRTADGIARRIELAVMDHLGDVPHDDIAIMVVRAALHVPADADVGGT
jgi:serine phosphatase RsbU (regulator of sigma subunit)